MSIEVIKSLHRWKRIGLIRELSGAATADKNADHAGMSRFARSLRVGLQQQMQAGRAIRASGSIKLLSKPAPNLDLIFTYGHFDHAIRSRPTIRGKVGYVG